MAAVPTPITKIFATVLKQKRKELNLSQVELAKLAGLKRSHISLFECAKREPSLSTMGLLAEAMGMRPFELMVLLEEHWHDRN